MKSRSREISNLNYRIALKFDRHVGSSAAEVPVKFLSDRTILNTNLAASRLSVDNLVSSIKQDILLILVLSDYFKRWHFIIEIVLDLSVLRNIHATNNGECCTQLFVEHLTPKTEFMISYMKPFPFYKVSYVKLWILWENDRMLQIHMRLPGLLNASNTKLTKPYFPLWTTYTWPIVKSVPTL